MLLRGCASSKVWSTWRCNLGLISASGMDYRSFSLPSRLQDSRWSIYLAAMQCESLSSSPRSRVWTMYNVEHNGIGEKMSQQCSKMR